MLKLVLPDRESELHKRAVIVPSGGTSGAERALNISSREALQRESLVRVLSRDELRGTACRSRQSSIKNEEQNCV